MNTATDEYSIAALARSTVRPETAATSARPRQAGLLMAVRPLCFELLFVGGQRLKVELHGSGSEPTSLWRVLTTIKHLANMPAGWNSYGAKPLDSSVARRTLLLLAFLLENPNTPDPNVIPRSDGGLQLEWHRMGWDVEIVIRPSGPINYYVATGTDEREWSGFGGRLPIRDALANLAQEA